MSCLLGQMEAGDKSSVRSAWYYSSCDRSPWPDHDLRIMISSYDFMDFHGVLPSWIMTRVPTMHDIETCVKLQRAATWLLPNNLYISFYAIYREFSTKFWHFWSFLPQTPSIQYLNIFLQLVCSFVVVVVLLLQAPSQYCHHYGGSRRNTSVHFVAYPSK